MNQPLRKYKLEFDSALSYVREELEGVNTLSILLLNLLKFEDGIFFTLLPENANLEMIHQFECGGILPQFLEEEGILGKRKTIFTRIPNINNSLSQLILKKIVKEKEFSLIVDDVLRKVCDKYHKNLFDSHGLFYNDEVYYVLEKSNVSTDLILNCLKASTSFWHSLGVFTTADLTGRTSNEFDLRKIEEICLNTELMMVGAYDGEGYIFWEKDLTNNGKGFFSDC